MPSVMSFTDAPREMRSWKRTLKPTTSPSGVFSSSAMRLATLDAAIRRGCVWPIQPPPLARPRPIASAIFGNCVVLPEPVSPLTMTTGWARIAAAISSRRADTGSASGNSIGSSAGTRSGVVMGAANYSRAGARPFSRRRASPSCPPRRRRRESGFGQVSGRLRYAAHRNRPALHERPSGVPMSEKTKTRAAARRRFLKNAATATGAASALAVPMVSQAQTTNFRFQSTWPAKDIFHEYANDFAKKVNDMAGGRLKIEVLPSGAVVPAFQLLEAVNKGTLDGGHGVVAYHYGKNSALALWGSGPAFGMNPNIVLSWHYYGGGKALLEEIYKSINMDVVSYLYGPMQTQPLGWFKKPVSNVSQFKGLKYRTVGLAVDLFTDLGLAVNPLPGGEIVPALDRGLIEAAEFNNASSDRALGFP